MNTAKGVLNYFIALGILGWAVGCIIVGIIFASAIGNWHPGFNDHPWGVTVGCLAYFALIVPIVWVLRRKPAKA